MSSIIVLRTEEILDDFLGMLKATDVRDEVIESLIKQATRKALSDYDSVSNKIELTSLFGVKFVLPLISMENKLSDSGEWSKKFLDYAIQFNLLALRLLTLFQKENIPMTINPTTGDLYCPYDYECVIYDNIHLSSSTTHSIRHPLHRGSFPL